MDNLIGGALNKIRQTAGQLFGGAEQAVQNFGSSFNQPAQNIGGNAPINWGQAAQGFGNAVSGFSPAQMLNLPQLPQSIFNMGPNLYNQVAPQVTDFAKGLTAAPGSSVQPNDPLGLQNPVAYDIGQGLSGVPGMQQLAGMPVARGFNLGRAAVGGLVGAGGQALANVIAGTPQNNTIQNLAPTALIGGLVGGKTGNTEGFKFLDDASQKTKADQEAALQTLKEPGARTPGQPIIASQLETEAPVTGEVPTGQLRNTSSDTSIPPAVNPTTRPILENELLNQERAGVVVPPTTLRSTNELAGYIDRQGYRTPEQITKLTQDIKTNGIKYPVELIKNQDGTYEINDGTHRIQIAQDLGIKQLPTKVVQDKSVDTLVTPTTNLAGTKLSTKTTAAGIDKELNASKPPESTPPPPPEKFKINLNGNEKQVAGDIRTEVTGLRNKQIVAGNNLADLMGKTISKEENTAIKWYNEAGGDQAKLSQWLNDKDPLLDPYRKEIQDALNLSPQAKKVAQQIQAHYDFTGVTAKKLGTINDVIDNYNARIYKAEPPKTFTGSTGGGQLKTSTSHKLQRTYDTIYDAVKGGKSLADTTATENMAIHNEEMAHVNSARQMTTEMKASGIGGWFNPNAQPEGWTRVGQLENRVPFVDKDGQAHVASKQFYAPKGIANGLAAVADPNFAKRLGIIRGVSRYQGLVKTVDLSYSLFHHLTLTAQLLYQTKGGFDLATHLPQMLKTMDTPALSEAEQDFARFGGITSKIEDNQDILRNLNKGDDLVAKATNSPILKGALALSQKSSNFLFGTMQRYSKIMDYQNKVSGWISKHPDATDIELTSAKRGFAKEVNAAYGGLNWEQMGITKSMQTLLRTVFLAPDWLVSNASLAGKYAFEGGTAGAAARSNLFVGIAGGLLLTETLSKILTGHFTTQNKKGHLFEVEIAPNVYFSFLRGAPGEAVKLISNTVDNGPIQGPLRYAQGKLSPLARTGIEAATGIDYSGRNIYQGKTILGKNVNGALNLAASAVPVPIGGSSLIKYFTDKQNTPNPLGAGAVATGLGRYSISKNTPKNIPFTNLPLAQGASADSPTPPAQQNGPATPVQKAALQAQVQAIDQKEKDVLSQGGPGWFGTGLTDQQKNDQVNKLEAQKKQLQTQEKNPDEAQFLASGKPEDIINGVAYYKDSKGEVKSLDLSQPAQGDTSLAALEQQATADKNAQALIKSSQLFNSKSLITQQAAYSLIQSTGGNPTQAFMGAVSSLPAKEQSQFVNNYLRDPQNGDLQTRINSLVQGGVLTSSIAGEMNKLGLIDSSTASALKHQLKLIALTQGYGTSSGTGGGGSGGASTNKFANKIKTQMRSSLTRNHLNKRISVKKTKAPKMAKIKVKQPKLSQIQVQSTPKATKLAVKKQAQFKVKA